MILAAGKGERLGGVTQTIPKALVQVAGRTLLEHAIDRLIQANIQNITLAIGWKSDMIRDTIHQFEDFPAIQIVEIPNYEIGPLQTLTTALDTIPEKESIICPVDLIISSDAIRGIVKHHTSNLGTLVTLAVDAQSSSGSMVSLDSSGHVLAIQKEIDTADSIVKSAMFMVASSGFLENCRKALSNGCTTAVSVLNEVITTGLSIQSYNVSERWFDIDTIADVIAANRYLLESAKVQFAGSIFIPSGDIVAIGDELHF